VARFEAALFAGRRGSFNASEEAQSLSAYRRECAAETEAERATIAARAEMNSRRAAYLEAHREHEVVKNLESRARTAHGLAASREEQAELDDLAGRRARRQQLARAC
jgi:flagellar FliJ protein